MYDAFIDRLHNTNNCIVGPYIYDCVCRRFTRFADSCVNSESPLVSFVARHGISTAQMSSIIGRNIYFCAKRYCCSPEDLMAASRNYDSFFNLVYPQTNLADIDRVPRVLEMIFVRDGFFTLRNMSRLDIVEMISSFVTE